MTITITELDEAALLANFTPAQVAKARQCVAAGGVEATAHRGEFRVRSSDGSHTYLTAVDACGGGCRAGEMGRICWHRAAVILTNLAEQADARKPLDYCPEGCWAFRHFDYCEHTG